MKTFIAFLILFLPFPLLAQQKNIPLTKMVNIEGFLKHISKENIIYIRQYDGISIPVKVDAKGHFNIEVPIKEPGFYQLDKVGDIYLSPGYQLRLLMREDSSITFYGQGSRENSIYRDLKKSVELFLPFEQKIGLVKEAYHMEAPAFLQEITGFENYSKKILSEVPDTYFREIVIRELECDDNRLLLNYMKGYGMDKGVLVKRIDSSSKKQIEKRIFYDLDPNQVKLYKNSSSYRRAVDEKFLYLMYTNIRPLDIRNKEVKILLQKRIANEMVREPYILGQLNCAYTISLLKLVSSPIKRDSIYRSFNRGTSTKAQKSEVYETYRRQLDYGNNTTAPDFSYHDVNGKKVKLSDLRGKYTYIDIWATWCGPCKAQIPFLAKLESDYKGKDIQFLSISVDESKDRGKWATFVKDQRLGGIQVMADNAFKSEFIQKFNIYAIPRFILISPQGKIISTNAKRPSDPELQKEINELLSKNK